MQNLAKDSFEFNDVAVETTEIDKIDAVVVIDSTAMLGVMMIIVTPHKKAGIIVAIAVVVAIAVIVVIVVIMIIIVTVTVTVIVLCGDIVVVIIITETIAVRIFV